MVNKRSKKIVQYGVGLLALFFMIYGFHRGEVNTVLNKAINICLECIGLG